MKKSKSPRKPSDVLRGQLEAIKESHQKTISQRRSVFEADKKLVDNLAAYDQLASREEQVRKRQKQRELKQALDNSNRKSSIIGDGSLGMPLKQTEKDLELVGKAEKREKRQTHTVTQRPAWFG